MCRMSTFQDCLVRERDLRDFRDFIASTGLGGRSENEAVNRAVVCFLLSLGDLHKVPHVPEVHESGD